MARNKRLDYTVESRYFPGEDIDIDYKDTEEFHILKSVDYLRLIVKSDRELKNYFLRTIVETCDYHQETAKQMQEFTETVEKWSRYK